MTLLRHLAIRCVDMEKSRRFYADAFGWKAVGYRPNGLGFDFTDGTNNITLLQQPAEMVRPRIEEGSEYIHFGVIVDDLEACWDRLKSMGAELSKDDIKDRNEVDLARTPTRSFKVLDPDGNVIDVTANREEWRGILA
ncbi:MAG: VOC family protein [Planctomycetaceae bacterium]